MTTLRLYHLAHEWQLDSSAMLAALHEAGRRQVKSHFVEIPYEEVEELRHIFEDAGLFEQPEPEASEVEPSEAEAASEAPAEGEVAAEGEAATAASTPSAAEEKASDEEPAASDGAKPEPAATASASAKSEAKPKPKSDPARPKGVASTFLGFAPGFDPEARARRERERAAAASRDSSPFSSLPGSGVGAGKRHGSRTAVSPTRRGKQTTRRTGGQAQQGRGRRLERRMQERDRWHKVSRKRRQKPVARNVVRPEHAEIQLPISLKDLSAKLAIRVPEIMTFLMKTQGLLVSINKPVPREAVELVGLNWNIDLTIKDEVTAEKELLEKHESVAPADDPDAVPRPPVIAVLGHVDHGKTSLLDYIRKTKKPVTAQEAGGITQHIGAYVAEHNKQKLTFIDTPGHEAFTEMRVRGARVTDIVLLVIAADDGVMPQTKEAIQHAQAAGAHIIVAANKIDKKGADVNKVMQDLSQIEGMLPQEWGGETEVVPCSAVTGQGVDDLLETILTYAELLELKANPKKKARGTILEARKTVGRGIVATALVQEGTLKKGDLIVAGRAGGKVRSMFNDLGKTLKSAGPATPVELLGFDDVPEAGEQFFVVEKEAELKRVLAERREAALRGGAVSAFDHIPTDEQGIWTKLAQQEIKEVRVVLKTDVQGSLQVIKRELGQLSTEEVTCKVIRDGVGAISTADVLLAAASDAVVIGFGVTADAKARRLAKEKGVEIATYRVIYELIDGVKEIMAGALEPEEREEVIGHVEVRKVFSFSKIGSIAGCFVKEGIVRRNAMVRLSRDGIVLWQGEIASLRRFKDDVKEVRENFECGIVLKGYNDIKPGDELEVFEIQQIARTLD